MKVRIWSDGDYQVIKRDDEELKSYKSNDFIVRDTEECINCGDMIIPEYDEPFGTCGCCTQEWYR